MKKLLILAVVVCMTALLLASCSGTNDINTSVIDDIEDKSYEVSGKDGKEIFDYEITELNTIRIIGYTGSFSIHEVTVPSVIDEIEVTDIGAKAFYYANNISAITLPETVKVIDDWAFAGCTYLKNVNMTESVTTIGTGAFYGCTAIEDIKLPTSITEIDKYAFYGCTALKAIDVPANVKTIGESAFWGCTSLKEVTGLSGVTEVAAYAFNGCTALESTKLKADAKIGEYAFNGCEKLK